jgi:hypothetical protein
MKPTRHSESGLLFDWQHQERTGAWLFMFVLLTVGGFALLFILFRIVTPEAPKLTSRPQQMIVLNPNVEADRALINRAVDRSFTLLPSETANLREVPSEAKIPSFEPPVSNFELKLKAPQEGSRSRESPLLFADDIDVLPALPVAAALEAKATPPVHLRPQIDAAKAIRLMSSPELKDIPLTDPSRPLFRLAVGSLGQVLMALPLGSSEDPAVMVKLHTAMTQLRFEPTGKDLEWVQISFAWEKEAAK